MTVIIIICHQNDIIGLEIIIVLDDIDEIEQCQRYRDVEQNQPLDDEGEKIIVDLDCDEDDVDFAMIVVFEVIDEITAIDVLEIVIEVDDDERENEVIQVEADVIEWFI